MKDSLCAAKFSSPSRPSSGLQPATRRWRASVCRSSGRPASTKNISATAVRRSPFPYARRPRSRLGNPARLEPFRGKASIPPGVASTGSGAVVCLDLSGFVSACVHPCPENGTSPNFSARSSASTGPASFLADPDHASAIRKSNKVKKEQPPHPKRRAAVAAVAAPPTVTPNSPPTHQR